MFIDLSDKKIVVVGGGNVAIDAARISSRCTDAKISMFCLETREKMPASNEEIEEALEEGIELNCGWGPKEVLEEDGHVSGVVFKKCTRVFDAQGRFSPEYDENDTVTIPCRHVIFSVGQAIDWGHMLDNLHVELRPNGGALANKLTYQTSEPDIFVGGDVYTGPKFAIDAIAAGREGAVSLHRYVHEHCTLTIGRNRRDFIELDKENIKVETYDSSSRQIPPKADVKEQAKTFRDLSQSLTEEQVKKETSRCLSCGASVVDPNKCIGCGRCEAICPRGNIAIQDHFPVFNRQACVACKACERICPQNAIKFVGESITSSEIMEILLRDRDYYLNSGGGVTFSGGEAFTQFEGLMDLLIQCKNEKLHTSVETCGQVNLDKIKQALPLIDLFLFDIKHTDKDLLQKETGANLDTILTNLRYISSKSANKVTILVPVIPGFNFNENTLREIFMLAKENRIKCVHLLPYHTLGKDKYEQLGLTYPYPCEQMLAKEELFPFKEMGEKMGLEIRIGG